jgi:integrase
MARKSILDNDRFTFNLYTRTLPKGVIYYARFFEKGSPVILADRSTGEEDKDSAKIAAGKLLALLPLEKISRIKTQQHTDKYLKAEGLKNMSLAEYLVWFWTANLSDYIKDRIDAEKPLTKNYIKTQHQYMSNYASTYVPFKNTALRDTTLYLLEQWMHHLKRNFNKNKVVSIMTAAQTPFSWAKKRKLMEDSPDWSAIVQPKKQYKKRGILTRAEVAKIVALETLDIMKPRPRLKDGKKNEGLAPIDIRIKAIILLSELAAMRRGEIRALRWGKVDFDTGLIDISESYTEADGYKNPKQNSIGIVPMANELHDVLKELKKVSAFISYDKDEDFVIFNIKRSVPISDSTIKRGFRRALTFIGKTMFWLQKKTVLPITEASRQGV